MNHWYDWLTIYFCTGTLCTTFFLLSFFLLSFFLTLCTTFYYMADSLEDPVVSDVACTVLLWPLRLFLDTLDDLKGIK